MDALTGTSDFAVDLRSDVTIEALPRVSSAGRHHGYTICLKAAEYRFARCLKRERESDVVIRALQLMDAPSRIHHSAHLA